ncbi:MAG: hypothetical protein CVU39_00040 [Chloroflexi bacterium HGW-Chloroflexi-10]|nr:MAG: hypothetical protein CVU39_00040 [Chloroflexi bacterium HGW-Chloroflexi-10]
MEFSEVNIQKLFGNEAAEDEDPTRLKEYYFKTNIYNQVVADLPLRILVGHKGIGKSALFKIAMDEETEKGSIALMIQPNDIANIGVDTTNFLLAIRNWSENIKEIITKKLFSNLGISQTYASDIKNHDGKISDYVYKVINSLKDEVYIENRFDSIMRLLENFKVSVYIDDLDRGWQGKKEDITRISTLINAVRDLSNGNRNISFRIALRSDVYFLYRTSDESTDKIEGSVVWHTWNNHEIFVLLIKRIETFFGNKVDEELLLHTPQSQLAKYLYPVMEERFTGRGLWENAPLYKVLMSLIRKRPRDLVKLCTLAARNAYLNKSNIIQTSDFQAIFENYSQGRIQDTINEYRSELPNIESLIMNMKPNKRERTTKEGYVYTTEKLLEKIKNIMGSQQFIFANEQRAEAKDLASFLYKVNFLTARKEISSGKIERKYFEENRYLSSQFVDFGFDWEIHPAYRWALQPSDQNTIYDSLFLSQDIT